MDQQKQKQILTWVGVFIAGIVINQILGALIGIRLSTPILIVVLYFIARSAVRKNAAQQSAQEPIPEYQPPQEAEEPVPAEPQTEDFTEPDEIVPPAPAGPVCAYCGSALEDGAKFCGNCGAPTGGQD